MLRFTTWNVKHFGKEPSRAVRCAEFVAQFEPDVFAIFEVSSKEVFGHFRAQMPEHNFFISEGPQSQETLVGVRKTLSAFVTTRQEFKSKIPTLRPGVLATVEADSELYAFLFLHIKSGSKPLGWGLRDDMMEHARSLKKALDAEAQKMGQAAANFIIAGDLNTMGMNVTYADNDSDGKEEIDRLSKRFKESGMTLLDKDATATWMNTGNRYPPSDLDHVIASDHLQVTGLNGEENLSVLGWPTLTSPAEKVAWVEEFSDHALVLGEVQ